MVELKILILFIFLAAASVWDLKERCIPVSVFILAGITIICLECGSVTEDILGKFGGMAVGVILLAISKWTGGQIGEGDGFAFLITGFGLGFGENFLLLFEALLLSFAWSLLLMWMRKINLKTSLPFLPFVLTAFLIRFVPQIFFRG